MKKCARCNETKNFDQFGKNSALADGKCVYCRECARQIGRATYERLADKRCKAQRDRYANNEEYRKQCNERRYQNYWSNRDAILEKQRQKRAGEKK